ncbi:recombinase family protein [Streptomyces sp. NPDC050400]|uniref:recombinase family protein n=1 Tax=Streptomyces sp. NPDC050400 TaxID=3365610 RepID=UPI00378C32E4
MRTDETTSPTRQREANERSARAINARIIGEAEDLDVSALKTTPFERPALGEWLRERSRFDVILWWRLDRAVRSMANMHELARWAREYRKMLVFAEGPGGMLTLDFRNPLDPIAVLAFAAQMEAQAIGERGQGAAEAIRSMPLRWREARAPYPYMPAPMPDGAGKTLVSDLDAVKVVEKIIKYLLEDENADPTSIAVALNSGKSPIPSSRDHWAIKQGRETGGWGAVNSSAPEPRKSGCDGRGHEGEEPGGDAIRRDAERPDAQLEVRRRLALRADGVRHTVRMVHRGRPETRSPQNVTCRQLAVEISRHADPVESMQPALEEGSRARG